MLPTRKCYRARDYFLGDNEKSQDFARSLNLARQCEEKEAVWLVSCFPDGPPLSKRDAYNTFLAVARVAQCDEEKSWALYYAFCCCDVSNQVRSELLLESYRMGYCAAVAVKYYWWDLNKGLEGGPKYRETRLKELLVASSKGERLAMLHVGEITEKREFLVRAAKLGLVSAMITWAQVVSCDVQRRHWYGKAMAKNSGIAFQNFILRGSPVQNYIKYGSPLDERIEFEMAKYASKFVGKAGGGPEREEISHTFRVEIASYRRAKRACRAAIYCWTMVGLRLGIYKDVRGIISRLLCKSWRHFYPITRNA